MKAFWQSLTPGVRALLLVAVILEVATLAGMFTRTFDLVRWLALQPQEVLRGSAWQLLTHAFLPVNPLDLVLGGLTFVVLGVRLERDWSALQLWSYCFLVAIFAGLVGLLALPEGFLLMGLNTLVAGFLAAWLKFYRDERVLLLGLVELSVRQVVVFFIVIQIISVIGCSGGLIAYLVSLTGGIGGWIYLTLRSWFHLGARTKRLQSERMGRLEL